MPPTVLNPFKSFRTGTAFLCVFTMLSLAACTADSEPVAEPTAISSPTESELLVIDPTDAPMVEDIEEAPLAEDTPGSEYIAIYPIPAPGEVTSVGEPIEDAEARFLEGTKDAARNGETDAEILNFGYASCGFMSEVTTEAELISKIKAFSVGNHEVEVLTITASETALKTICPEFTDFGEPVIETAIPSETAMG